MSAVVLSTAGLSPRRAEAEVQVLDVGHFALDTAADQIAPESGLHAGEIAS